MVIRNRLFKRFHYSNKGPQQQKIFVQILGKLSAIKMSNLTFDFVINIQHKLSSHSSTTFQFLFSLYPINEERHNSSISYLILCLEDHEDLSLLLSVSLCLPFMLIKCLLNCFGSFLFL